MARAVGGHIAGPTLAVTPAPDWTDPAIGNLVVWDPSGNTRVKEAVADDRPIGQVISVHPSRAVLTLELFTGGMVAVLPYSSLPVLGDSIEADGTVNAHNQGRVRVNNLDGAGRVIARDRAAGYVDVYFG